MRKDPSSEITDKVCRHTLMLPLDKSIQGFRPAIAIAIAIAISAIATDNSTANESANQRRY